MTKVYCVHVYKHLLVTLRCFSSLSQGDMNVIAVEWKKGAYPLNYLQAVANTRLVSRMVAHFLQQMKSTRGLDMSQVHIIGHSLGAHIAGYIGEEVSHISRISGI